MKVINYGKMEVVKAVKIPSTWLAPKDIKIIISRKNISEVLKKFRNFADAHPSYFGEFKPYLKSEGNDRQYNIYCFLHYYENRSLLDAGSRYIKFDLDEARRIRETYAP